MPTPAQAYLNLSANMGRGSTASGVSSDQGAEKFINNSATAGALGATAVFPAVVNNMSYADDYVNLTKTVNKVGQAGAVYSSYKTALGLAGPQGSEQMGNTFSPGNLMRAGVETASYLNPVTGVLNAVNSMTKNEQNPQGTLPGVSYVQGKVDQFGNALNNTKVGNFMSNTAQAFHENFISPVLQTRPGQILTSVAGIPMGAVESGYNALREGYQGLDRNFFGGYLPGGARDGDAETQRFDNPLRPLNESLDHFGNTLRNDQRQPEAIIVPGGPVNNSSPNAEALFNDMVVDGELITAEEIQNIKQNPTPGQEAHMDLDYLKTYAESTGMDMDSTPSQSTELNDALKGKGLIFENDVTFSTGSYKSTGGDLPMVDLGAGPVPVIKTKEFKTWLNNKREELGGTAQFMEYYRVQTGADHLAGVYTHPSVFEHSTKIDPNNPSAGIDRATHIDHYAFQGMNYDVFVNEFMAEVNSSFKPQNNQYTYQDPGRQFTGIDLNPVAGVQREIGRQGASIGGGSGITTSGGYTDNNFGDYRILL